jgi:hypothetical protein
MATSGGLFPSCGNSTHGPDVDICVLFDSRVGRDVTCAVIVDRAFGQSAKMQRFSFGILKHGSESHRAAAMDFCIFIQEAIPLKSLDSSRGRCDTSDPPPNAYHEVAALVALISAPDVPIGLLCDFGVTFGSIQSHHVRSGEGDCAALHAENCSKPGETPPGGPEGLPDADVPGSCSSQGPMSEEAEDSGTCDRGS